jgi:hypothetical protein
MRTMPIQLRPEVRARVREALIQTLPTVRADSFIALSFAFMALDLAFFNKTGLIQCRPQTSACRPCPYPFHGAPSHCAGGAAPRHQHRRGSASRWRLPVAWRLFPIDGSEPPHSVALSKGLGRRPIAAARLAASNTPLLDGVHSLCIPASY